MKHFNSVNLGPHGSEQEEQEMSNMLQINVNEHTEKKNGLTYISWAWAWAETLKVDPLADYTVTMFDGKPYCDINGTAMVFVTVTIKNKARTCQLPVMDHRNKAIREPDAFAVNTAIMRCMTKALSLHGLGLYIYAGEDLPESDEKHEKVQPTVIKATDGVESMVNEVRRSQLDEMALDMIQAWKDGRQMDCADWWYDSSNFADNEERVYLWKQLSAESKLRAFIKANNPQKEAA